MLKTLMTATLTAIVGLNMPSGAQAFAGSGAISGPQLVEFAEPVPSFDNPRKIMLQISTADTGAINSILYNAINVQKFYGIDNVQIAIVVFGQGMTALYADESPVADRVTSLMKYGIEFVGCGNTMEIQHRTADELIEGVTYVQAGIPEIVERQLKGWAYVRP